MNSRKRSAKDADLTAGLVGITVLLISIILAMLIQEWILAIILFVSLILMTVLTVNEFRFLKKWNLL